MKRFLLFLTAIILQLPLSAQETNAESSSKHTRGDEIRIGWATSPTFYLSQFTRTQTYFGSYSLGTAYPDTSTGTYSTGVFSIEYSHFFKKWLSICADTGCSFLWNKNVNAYSDPVPSDKGVAFHILPKVRFSYVNKDVVRLYSDVGMGLGAVSGSNKLNATLLFHCTPIGITVGKRVYGFAELNLSMRNLGAAFGIGYRFKK